MWLGPVQRILAQKNLNFRHILLLVEAILLILEFPSIQIFGTLREPGWLTAIAQKTLFQGYTIHYSFKPIKKQQQKQPKSNKNNKWLCLFTAGYRSVFIGVMWKVFECFPAAICEVLTSHIICLQVLAVLNYKLQMKQLLFFFPLLLLVVFTSGKAGSTDSRGSTEGQRGLELAVAASKILLPASNFALSRHCAESWSIVKDHCWERTRKKNPKKT